MQELQAQIDELKARLDAFGSYDTLAYENLKAIETHFPKMLFGEATLDFPNTGAGASSLKTITLYGAKPGDIVALGMDAGASGAGSFYVAYVSAQDVVTIEYQNQTAGAQNPDPALKFKVAVIQK